MRWRRFGAALTAGLLLGMAPATSAHAEDPTPVVESSSPSPTPSQTPSAPAPDATTPAASPTSTPPATAANPVTPPDARPAPVVPPRTKLPLREKHTGDLVSKAQARLAWLGYELNPTSVKDKYFGKTTTAAVKKFQIKFWLKPTGVIDTTTWKKLSSIAEPLGKLPKQCLESTTICADKTQKILRYVVKGKVVMTVDARFGLPGMETGEGLFRVHERAYDHISSLYHTWMPRALFFNGDQAVHFSPYFQRDGYNGGSHGCIGIRDMEKATWLFNKVPMGGRVYVYRS